jgi:hypothetical protein
MAWPDGAAAPALWFEARARRTRKDSISLGADKRTFPIYETSIIARCLVAKKQSNEAPKEIKPDRPPLGR